MPLQKFINRGASHKPGAQDFVVPSLRTKALKPYDRRLRKFQFRDALDAALDTGDGRLVGLLLEELACRNALGAALGEHLVLSIPCPARARTYCSRSLSYIGPYKACCLFTRFAQKCNSGMATKLCLQGQSQKDTVCNFHLCFLQKVEYVDMWTTLKLIDSLIDSLKFFWSWICRGPGCCRICHAASILPQADCSRTFLACFCCHCTASPQDVHQEGALHPVYPCALTLE